MADDPNPGPYRKNAFVEPPPTREPEAVVAIEEPGLWTRKQRLRAACHALVYLHMEVVHHPGWVADPGQRQRPVDEVRIRLSGPIPRYDVERACAEARRAAPGLRATIDGDTIVLTRWPWHHNDVVLLAHLLATWGRALHDSCGIAVIDVAWWDGAPQASL